MSAWKDEGFVEGLFDLNGDGKMDAGEEFQAYQLFEDMSGDSAAQNSGKFAVSMDPQMGTNSFTFPRKEPLTDAAKADSVETNYKDGLRRKRCLSIATAVLIAFIFIVGLYKYNEDKPYQKMLELFDRGEYYQARIAIQKLGSYKDCWPLQYMAEAYEEYEKGEYEKADKSIGMWKIAGAKAKKSLPSKYREKFDDFLDQVAEAVAPIKLARQAKEAEEKRKQQEIANKEYEEAKIQLKDQMPYEGMKESYINLTRLGNYSYCSDLSKRYKRSYKVYIFKDSQGREAYSVTVQNGVVTNVWDKLGSLKKYTTTKKTSSDPYNAKSYSNEEDFYDDHYDDFMDYYEAEDYWRDHQ